MRYHDKCIYRFDIIGENEEMMGMYFIICR